MKTILVIDDELAIAEMLHAILEGEGYAVAIAANGQEALEHLASAPAELILSDLMMPILDGRNLARALKADPAYRAIPIVLMSAVGESLVGSGVDYQGFLKKPFHLAEVLELVERLIGKADP